MTNLVVTSIPVGCFKQQQRRRTMPPKVKLPEPQYKQLLALDKDFIYDPSETPKSVECCVCCVPWVQPVELQPCRHVLCRGCCAELPKPICCPECRAAAEEVLPAPRAISGVVDELSCRCLHCGNSASRGVIFTHECAPQPLPLLAMQWGLNKMEQGRYAEAVVEFRRGTSFIESRKPTKKKLKEWSAAQLYASLGHALLRSPGGAADSNAAQALAVADQAEGHACEVPQGMAAAMELRAAVHHRRYVGDGGTDADRVKAVEYAEKALLLAAGNGGAVAKAQRVLQELRPAAHASTQPAPTPAATPASAQGSAPPPEAATPTSANQASPNDLEPTVVNTYFVVQELWAQLGTKFTAWLVRLGNDELVEFIRQALPNIAARPGQTLDEETGEDVANISHLCPELNLQTLSQGAGSGLITVLSALTERAWRLVLMDSIHDIMGCVTDQPKTGRGKYLLRTHPTSTEETVVVNSVTGATENVVAQGVTHAQAQADVFNIPRKRDRREWVPGYVRVGAGLLHTSAMWLLSFASTAEGKKAAAGANSDLKPHPTSTEDIVVVDSVSGAAPKPFAPGAAHSEMEAFYMAKKRERREWVPGYVRRHTIDRLCLLLHTSAMWLLSFASTAEGKKAAVGPLPKLSHTFGCLGCGAKTRPVLCSSCELARYCTTCCLEAHKDAHGSACGAGFFSHKFTDTVEKAFHENTPSVVHDPENLIIQELSDWKKNLADPFGDGDQSFLNTADSKPQQLWLLRARTSLGFEPADPTTGCYSDFLVACVFGRVDTVRDMIMLAQTERERFELVNRRETLLRMSPLLTCITGARIARYAPSQAYVAVATVLIDAGADPKAKDSCGFSTIHHAGSGTASDASLMLLPLLVAAGADPNCRNRFGEPPLDDAMISRHLDAVRALIQVGANPAESGVQCPLADVRELILNCASVRGLRTGEAVQIDGIVAKPHLNGKTGTVGPAEKHGVGRVCVELDNGEGTLTVKLENLRRCATHTCAKCGVSATLACSRCKAVKYCGVACQRAHWTTHKPQCAVAPSTIVIPRKTYAPTNTSVTNLIGGPRIAMTDGGNIPLKRKGNFPIKVQIRVERNAMKNTPQCTMTIYDETRAFWWDVLTGTPGHKELYSAVFAFGVKAYFTAIFENKSGDLHIERCPVAPQPW
jgi:hypothetical protein